MINLNLHLFDRNHYNNKALFRKWLLLILMQKRLLKKLNKITKEDELQLA